MVRELSIKFTSYNIAKYEQENNTTVLDMLTSLQSGGMTIGSMAKFLTVGRNRCSLEDACDAIDKWLEAKEDNNILKLLIQLMCEYDMDTKVLSLMGVTHSMLLEEVTKQIESAKKQGSELISSIGIVSKEENNDSIIETYGESFEKSTGENKEACDSIETTEEDHEKASKDVIDSLKTSTKRNIVKLVKNK